MMEKFTVYTKETLPSENEKLEIARFLYEHLDQYGDAEAHILKAIDFSLNTFPSFGGFTLVLSDEQYIKGVVVINQTGMGGYIPENILVYIATHKAHRGEGLGKLMMKKTISLAKGDIALHVEANNPAKKLYEKYGFTNPYLEMRLKR